MWQGSTSFVDHGQAEFFKLVDFGEDDANRGLNIKQADEPSILDRYVELGTDYPRTGRQTFACTLLLDMRNGKKYRCGWVEEHKG
jgi:hypothetical protein